ncbi:protein KRI1 homolog [Dreissena polymorpha]|uniref:Protein KRI1 homolog n=1 Tax=Dreissena polymorpha TaxID=45954 RepID=A0A9D4HJ54_DREPO|nr:protein KRI1 homolog [Dreissena polymorpha]KAH3721145.1 hypothetical protein DPMN_064061 [Dreissena polymorpha]
MSDGFKINKAYADRYNNWRQKEELQKLKDKYGDEGDSGSSSSETEDDDAEALTDELERDWLRTLAALKSKDPKIYQKDFRFFNDEKETVDEEKEEKSKTKKDKDKPMYLKDYERKILLEKGGIIDETEQKPSTSGIGYQEEQEMLRKSVVAAAGDLSDESDSEGSLKLLKPREKTRAEKQREEADYLEWLKGQSEGLGVEKQVGVELEPLKNYWQRKDLDDGEKFLKNYILNKQYIDKDGEGMPTYDEIVNDDDEDLSEEEELLVKQADFERKYNFRFEEPDAAEIKSYPRDMEDTVRRKDTKRAEKRKATQERKKLEKERKRDDLKQLKKLKRQEIMSKIDKLRAITGNKAMAFDEQELEGEFDPAKHDEMMQKYFDDQYYGGAEEEVKPEVNISDDEYDTEKWDDWGQDDPEVGVAGEYEGGRALEEPNVEDPDFCMDADYDPVADMQRKQDKKNKKKKHKLAQALNTKKPVFDPKERTFEEYFDEYYKLDYEDIIDDMPCRFKYRKVTPNSFGLTVDEILKARDKELNAWASVKKMSQYRTEDEELADIRSFTAKGRNENKKKHILTSVFQTEEEKQEEVKAKDSLAAEASGSKKKKKKKGKKKKQDIGDETHLVVGVTNDEESGSVTDKDTGSLENSVSQSVKKKKEKHGAIVDYSENAGTEEDGAKVNDREISTKKKKKKKEKDFERESVDNVSKLEKKEKTEIVDNVDKHIQKEKRELVQNIENLIKEDKNESIENVKKHKHKRKRELVENVEKHIRKENSESIEHFDTHKQNKKSESVDNVEKHKNKEKDLSVIEATEGQKDKAGKKRKFEEMAGNGKEKLSRRQRKNKKRKLADSQAKEMKLVANKPEGESVKMPVESVSDKKKGEGHKSLKKKKNKQWGPEGKKPQMSEERLKAYGINPKKFKYMKREEMFQVKPRKEKNFKQN